MNNLSNRFELLLGHAAFELWPDLPREMQDYNMEWRRERNWHRTFSSWPRVA